MHCGRAATPSPPRPPPSSDSTRRGRFDVRGLAGASHVPRTVPLHFPRLADVLDRTGRTGPEPAPTRPHAGGPVGNRSEEHTSELQSLMRISYAVFCLTKKKKPAHPDHKNLLQTT